MFAWACAYLNHQQVNIDPLKNFFLEIQSGFFFLLKMEPDIGCNS